MKRRKVVHHLLAWVVGCIAVLLLAGSLAIPVKLVHAGAGAPFYKQFNLVSDIPTGPSGLIRIWSILGGIAFSPSGP